jgi:hypothetical protein
MADFFVWAKPGKVRASRQNKTVKRCFVIEVPPGIRRNSRTQGWESTKMRKLQKEPKGTRLREGATEPHERFPFDAFPQRTLK